MHTVLTAAGTATCNTGTWAQRWDCAWNQPTTGAAHAGTITGHSILPALIVIVLIVALVAAARKGRRSAPSSAGARR